MTTILFPVPAASASRRLAALSSRARRALLAIAVAALGLGLAAVHAAPAHAAPVAISEGSVDWGFKASWRAYIGESGITVSGGVSRTFDGGFRWPIESGSYDPDTRALELELAGTVHFAAHGGLLDATLSRGRLLIGGDGTELRFDIRSKNMAGDWVELTDAPLSVLDVEAVTPSVIGEQTTWTAIPNAITQQGTDAFTYGAGTMLDPLSISYTGPGGKPDLAERWTPPGTRGYTKTHVRDLLPGADWAASLRTGAFDEGAGILHAIGTPSGASTAHLLAIDLSTGQIVDQAGPVSWPTAGDISKGPFAFDAEHGTAFVRTPDNRLLAYTWNRTTRTYESEVLDEATPAANIMTYDPVGETVATITVSPASLVLVRRDGDGHFDAPVRRTVTGGTFGNNLVIDAQGIGLLTRASGTDRLSQFDATSASPVATIVTGVAPNTGIVTLGRDGEAWVAGTVTSFQRLQRVVRTTDGYVKSGDPTALPTPITGLQTGPGGDLIYASTTLSNQIHVFGDGQLKATLDVDGPADFANKRLIVHPRADGSLLVVHPDPTFAAGSTALSWPLDRYDFTGLSPQVTEQPADQIVTLHAGEQSAAAQLSVVASGTPAPQVRWQSRAGGIGRFVDVPGGTGATLDLDAERADDGTEYRAVLANETGSLATQPATLTVRYPPEISQQPVAVAVAEGEDAVLKVMPVGSPHPTVTWQRRSGGFWQPVDSGDGDVEVSGEGGGFLTIKSASREQSGSVFRAKIVNAVGTVFSNAATLTVHGAVTAPVTFGSGHVDWGFANRWRCYVSGSVARGGIDVAGGVTRIPGTAASGPLCPGAGAGSEALRFPVRGGSYDPASGRLEVRLDGTVRFWGHAYHVPGDPTPQLDTTFSNLRVLVEGTTGTLYADAVGATMDSPTPLNHKGVELVRLDLAGLGMTPGDGGLTWAGIPTALTAAGASVFGSYPTGEPFDPISLSLVYGTPRNDPDPDPPAGDPSAPPVPPVLPAPPPPGPALDPAPQPRPEPLIAPASVTLFKAPQVVSAKRLARVATVRCPNGSACAIKAPKTVAVRIAGKRHVLTVIAPKRIAGGKRATLQVRVSRAAAARLKGRRALVRFKITTTTQGKTATRTVKVTITAKKAKATKERGGGHQVAAAHAAAAGPVSVRLP